MSKTYIDIEQIDNGFLVNATDVADDGSAENVRYAVHDVNSLLHTLAIALTPVPVSPVDEVPLETDESSVIWPGDETEDDPTDND